MAIWKSDSEARHAGLNPGPSLHFPLLEPLTLPHHLGRSADTAFASRVGQSMILGMSHPASRGWLQSSGCCLGSRWRGHAGGLAISNRAPRSPSRIRGTGYVGVADDKRSSFLGTFCVEHRFVSKDRRLPKRQASASFTRGNNKQNRGGRCDSQRVRTPSKHEETLFACCTDSKAALRKRYLLCHGSTAATVSQTCDKHGTCLPWPRAGARCRLGRRSAPVSMGVGPCPC